MWAVGAAGTVLRFDGLAVSAVAVPTSADLLDVWGSGPNDVWIVGTGGTVLHFDGQSFTPIASGTTVDLRAFHRAPRLVPCPPPVTITKDLRRRSRFDQRVRVKTKRFSGLKLSKPD